ncbi:MAG: T9SS type A sorting domain-containing protein, partial [Bacteroidota bacterium]
ALKGPDVNALLKEDNEYNIPNRYSVYSDTVIHFLEVATKTETPQGTIMEFLVSAPGAESISLWFGKYNLPPGAELYIFNKDKTKYHGAFTSLNNKSYNALQISDFIGDNVIIEYFEPKNASFQGELEIHSIGTAYRNFYDVHQVESQKQELIDINCKEGDDWQLEKHAIARMTFKEGSYGYYCTGSLINNTSNNARPYFLTANHCISTDTVAKTLITYFNYEQEACGSTELVPSDNSISGATVTASTDRNDFSLLELSHVPPLRYKPYYAGWNAEDVGPSAAVSIHHPSGMPKKISIETDSVISYPSVIYWDEDESSLPHTHWEVRFDLGMTQGGSSGAPLFDQNRLIVGQLHGGAEKYDYYGKVSAGFDEGSSLIHTKRLKPWLDPLDLRVNSWPGLVIEQITPDAHFGSNIRNVCVGAPVQLQDKSAFPHDRWIWTISPESHSFVENTDSSMQNPVVTFNQPGTYTVSLEVANDYGSDEQTYTGFILAGDVLNISAMMSSREVCLYDKSPIKLTAEGGIEFKWLTDEASDLLSFSDTTGQVITTQVKNNVYIDSTQRKYIYLVGTHGTCTDTIPLSMRVIYPSNDNVEEAQLLVPGLNGPFSNRCATIQVNEPHPPIGDCNSQTSWCDEYLNGTKIIENSVWFKFIGPESGIVAIESDGFDNQMAVYEAESAADILSDDPDLFTILKANDDHIDEDYSATIERVDVDPGKTYWLQVDGGDCGTEGTFIIDLLDYSLSDIDEKPVFSSRRFSIYPNPTRGSFFIENKDKNIDSFEVSVYNIQGRLLYNKSLNNTDKHEISVMENMKKGLYLVCIKTEKGIHQEKIIIH